MYLFTLPLFRTAQWLCDK